MDCVVGDAGLRKARRGLPNRANSVTVLPCSAYSIVLIPHQSGRDLMLAVFATTAGIELSSFM